MTAEQVQCSSHNDIHVPVYWHRYTGTGHKSCNAYQYICVQDNYIEMHAQVIMIFMYRYVDTGTPVLTYGY